MECWMCTTPALLIVNGTSIRLPTCAEHVTDTTAFVVEADMRHRTAPFN